MLVALALIVTDGATGCVTVMAMPVEVMVGLTIQAALLVSSTVTTSALLSVLLV